MKSILFCSICICFLNGIKAQDLQPFQQGGKFGFKKDQSIVIAAQFDYVSHFRRGLALVQQNGKWGYIDPGGSWAIPAKFDKAQTFADGSAFVEVNGNIGIIDTLGNYVVEPEYTNITEDYSGYYLTKGKLAGFKAKEFDSHIPAIYASIDYHYGLNVGVRTDGKFDLYHDNKLLLANLNENVTNNDIYYYQKLIRVKQNGKYGLLHFANGWVINPGYAKIEEIQVPLYSLPGDESGITYGRIFALHTMNTDVIQDDESIPVEDSITFIRIDGSKISSQIFNRFETYYTEYMDATPYDIIKAWGKGKIYTMDQELKITETRYNSIEAHLEWYIAEDGQKYYILNRFKFPIDSFEYIHPHHQLMTYYNENSYEFTSDEQTVNEPYVIFQKGDPDLPEQAIYDLNLQKIISPWLKGKLYVSLYRTDFGLSAYTYGTEENVGFYVQGMPLGTEISYAPDPDFSFFFTNNTDFYYHFFNKVSQRDELYHTNINKATKLGEFDKIIYSNLLVKDSIYIPNDDIGEPYSTRMQLFGKGFLVLRDKGKFGLVSWNGKIFPPVYDSLIDNENTSLLHTLQNGRYGSIDVLNGNELSPFWFTPMYFLSDNYDEVKHDYYLRMESEKGSYYLDSKGKIFYCHFSDVNIRKTGRKYGLVGYSDLPDFDQNEVTVVPPTFKMIENTYVSYAYKARNKEKKWGIIDFMGDTLVPFAYDKLISGEFDISNGETYLRTRIKKKTGLVGLRDGMVIPAEFDEIKQFLYDYEMHMAFLVKRDNKFGLYNLNGEIILPCEFDEIKIERLGDDSDLRVVGVKAGMLSPRRFSNYAPYHYVYPLMAYNFISNNRAYRSNGAYLEEFDIETGMLLQKQDLSKASMVGTEYNISLRNGKFGACDREGNELIAAEYDFAEFMEGRDEVMIGYQKGVKYYIYVFTKERYTEQQW